MPRHSPRVQVPGTVAKGAAVLIRTLIDHQMETGLRRDGNGKLIPRRIINAFTCRYDSETVFHAELREAVAANPYLEFTLRATRSGRLEFIWNEDGGGVYLLSHDLVVT